MNFLTRPIVISKLVPKLIGILAFGLLSLGGLHFSSGRFLSSILAVTAWALAEIAIRNGRNPLTGPWAPPGSEKSEILHILWPLWRLGFLLNVIIMIIIALKTEGAQWLLLATLTPWVIFSALGITTAVLHRLLGGPEHIRTVVNQCRHLFYIIVGFGPFALLCGIGAIYVSILQLLQRDPKIIQFKSRRIVQRTFQIILKYLQLIDFIELNLFEIDKFNTHRSAQLIVGNHISIFDIISMIATINQCNTFIKQKYCKIPVMNIIINRCGYIPIDTTNPESIKKAMNRAKEILHLGETLVAWPEGTRTKDGQLGEFHNGVFRLALESKVDIQPAIFTSSEPVFNNRGFIGATTKRVRFSITFKPHVKVDTLDRITPGRVLFIRDKIRNIFLESLRHPEIPTWMRLKSLTPSYDAEGL